MKKIITILGICLALTVNSQTNSFNPRTGDSEMDVVLKDINTKAQKDLSVFKDEVSTKFGVPKLKIDNLLQVMPPGDVYMVAQTADVTKQPIETVSETYTKNKDKGWGEIAKQLGIKPGSKEFHELKNKTKEHGKGKSGEHGKGNSGEHGKGHGKK